MARRVSRQSQEVVMMGRWWIRAVIGAVFLALAYGFVSLAIDSGSLLEYGAAILLIWWGFHHFIRAIRFGLSR